MIKNEQLDFFFFHINKCGGTSVREILRQIPGSIDAKELQLYKHTEIKFLPEITQTNVFTMVRNPWERFHSMYYDIKKRFGSMAVAETKNLEYKAWYRRLHNDVLSRTFSDWILNGVYIHPAEKYYNHNPLNTLRKSMSYYIEGCDTIKVFKLEEKKDPQDYVDEYAKQFDKIKSALNLSYNSFARTSSAQHKKAAQEIWKRCNEAGLKQGRRRNTEPSIRPGG